MKTRNRVGRIFLYLMVGWLTFLPASFAFIPPSQFVVKTWANKHKGLKGLRTRSTISRVKADQSSEIHFNQITVYDFHSRVLRSHAYDNLGKELYAIERNLDRQAPVVDSILFEANSEKLTERLRKLGLKIPIESELLNMKDEDERRAAENESLQRFKGQASWVIGNAAKGDQPFPQLWIQKDTFIPLRIITESEDVSFEGHRFFQEFPYPKTIFLKEKEESEVVREDLVDFAVNPDLTELKRHFSAGLTEAGSSADSQVRALLEKYYLILR